MCGILTLTIISAINIHMEVKSLCRQISESSSQQSMVGSNTNDYIDPIAVMPWARVACFCMQLHAIAVRSHPMLFSKDYKIISHF